MAKFLKQSNYGSLCLIGNIFLLLQGEGISVFSIYLKKAKRPN